MITQIEAEPIIILSVLIQVIIPVEGAAAHPIAGSVAPCLQSVYALDCYSIYNVIIIYHTVIITLFEFYVLAYGSEDALVQRAEIF